MPAFTAAEVQRNFGRFQDLAQQEPVTITSHGRERCVLLSVETYRRMVRRQRVAVRVADLDDTDWAAIEAVAREFGAVAETGDGVDHAPA